MIDNSEYWVGFGMDWKTEKLKVCSKSV